MVTTESLGPSTEPARNARLLSESPTGAHAPRLVAFRELPLESWGVGGWGEAVRRRALGASGEAGGAHVRGEEREAFPAV